MSMFGRDFEIDLVTAGRHGRDFGDELVRIQPCAYQLF